MVSADNTHQVTLSVASGPGGFAAGSTTAVTVSSGVATFSNLVLTAAGGYALAAGAAGLTGANSAGFTVSPGPVSLLSFVAQPGTTTAGVAVSPAVKVQEFNAFGNPLSADNSGQVTLPAGYRFVF